ncbi:MAG: CDP-diacylglycerol--serine O-phosphatidyltransferase [Streptomycetaceae bacterium]|nr:CDP-diacylglycerol--serine O-phosphatidyltransferase [Streptomycetaceae bacterium]
MAEFGDDRPIPKIDCVDEETPLSSRISAADVLTLGNAACGFLAVYFLAVATVAQHMDGYGVPADRRSAGAAVVLMLIGALFDLCDGLVARKLRRSALGAELDNLADVITFGVAPAFFVVTWAAVPLGPRKTPAVRVALAVMIAGVLRLARFASTPGRPGVFQGMPIPMGALTVVSIVLLDLPFAVAAAGILTTAWLMVSRIEYPKPQGKLALLTMLFIAASVSCLTLWATDSPGGDSMLMMGASLQICLAMSIPVAAMTRRGARFIGVRMIR